MLLGRRRECGRIDALLDGARGGRSGVALVRGEAGIGKSALLGYARERADGFTLLEARGLEGESELAFSALADLLRPLLGGLGALPAPQAEALAGALALGPPVAGDRFAVAAGALNLVAHAAGERPVLAIVDDAHWLDASTAEAVGFLAQRLGDEGVVLLLGLRDGEASAFDRSGLPELVLDSLDAGEAEALLRRHAVDVAAPVARELVGQAAGNPLVLTELPASLTTAQLSGVEPLPDPLPVGRGLEAAYRARLDALDPGVREALVVAAAAGERLDALLAALPLVGRSAADLEAAEEAGLVEARGGRLAWRHPLLRSVAYAAVGPAAQRQAHRTLADAVGDALPAERAWHLASATVGTDDGVAELLERTAADARARRAHAPAGEAFERAASLTADREARARRLLEAGRDYQAAGWIDRARALLDEGAPLAGDPLLAADIAGQRGIVEMWGGDARIARELLTSAAARVEGADPFRAAGLLLAAGLAAQISGDVAATLESARTAEALGGRVDEGLELAIEYLLCNALALAGMTDEAEALLPRLLERSAVGGDVLHAAATVGHSLTWLERHDEARAFFRVQIAAARESGSLGFLPFLLACLAELDFREGDWDAAAAGAVESVRLAEETGQRNLLTFSLVTLARVQAGRGEVARCGESAARALGLAAELGAGSIEVYAGSALGLLELGTGDAAAAIATLERVRAHPALVDLGEPNVVQWRPDLIEAYVLAGRAEDARGELEALEREAGHTGRRWALAAAARCRGMLAEDFEQHFRDGIAEGGSAFERGRTELRLGERLRRLRRPAEAREALRSALEKFERLGAAPWAARARAELAATGLRPRRRPPAVPAELTPQETRIARLVASGGTNREIAAELFLSPKTVAYHLAKIYEKLGVNSRTQLAAIVARDAAERAG